MTYTVATANQANDVREIKAAMKALTGRAWSVKSGGGYSTRDQIIVTATPSRLISRMMTRADSETVKQIFSLDSRPVTELRIMPYQRDEALARLRNKLTA